MRVRIRWGRQLHERTSPLRLAAADGIVVLRERFRTSALDERTGSPLWSAPEAASRIAVHGDRCLTLERGEVLRCRELRTGNLLWRTGIAALAGHLAVGREIIVVGGWRGYRPLVGVDPCTGRCRWTTPAHTVTPLVTAEFVLIGTPGDRVVRGVDPRSGRLRREWSLPGPLPDVGQRPVFTQFGGRIFLRCGDRGLVELPFGRDTATPVFQHGNALVPDAGWCAVGRLWLRERSGGCVGVAPRTGAGALRLAVAEPVVGVTTCGGAMLAAGANGGLHLFSVDEPGAVDDQVAPDGPPREIAPRASARLRHRFTAITNGIALTSGFALTVDGG